MNIYVNNQIYGYNKIIYTNKMMTILKDLLKKL